MKSSLGGACAGKSPFRGRQVFWVAVYIVYSPAPCSNLQIIFEYHKIGHAPNGGCPFFVKQKRRHIWWYCVSKSASCIVDCPVSEKTTDLSACGCSAHMAIPHRTAEIRNSSDFLSAVRLSRMGIFLLPPDCASSPHMRHRSKGGRQREKFSEGRLGGGGLFQEVPPPRSSSPSSKVLPFTIQKNFSQTGGNFRKFPHKRPIV